MEGDTEKELSEELKRSCKKDESTCKWKETNPEKSAQIVHKLGLLYKDKCLDENRESMERKVTFIQSAALLNGALVRDPNEEIKKDLQGLCSELLKAAGANQQEYDLPNYSSSLKKEIEYWRKSLRSDIDDITPIPDEIDDVILTQLEQQKVDDVETLQTKITDKYKSLMRQVSGTCISVLGQVPCQYALVGMGSMARKEITPYSDFENMILLKEGVQFQKEEDYEKIKEYFRWLAVIFQVILINLGETILPSVAIPSLNDYITPDGDWFFDDFTKRGVSFDGMMPLTYKSPMEREQILEKKTWKTELIRPVSEMVQYLEHEDLKNGYHLADILTSTCFVTGNQNVYRSFEEAVQLVFCDSKDNPKQEAINIIKKDMETYSTKLNISTTIDNNSYNVKQFVYRSTTVFITGLAKIYNISPGSCFDITQRMSKNKLISDAFEHKLQYAVAIACEIRLKTYFDKGCQDDYVDSLFNDDNEDIASELIKAVGKRSCYDYFEIACCLQYDTITTLRLSSDFMYFHPVAMCITISSFLNLYDRLIAANDYVHEYLILRDQPEPADDDADEFYDDVLDDNVSNDGDGYHNLDCKNVEDDNDINDIKSTVDVETCDTGNDQTVGRKRNVVSSGAENRTCVMDMDCANSETYDDVGSSNDLGNATLGDWYSQTQKFNTKLRGCIEKQGLLDFKTSPDSDNKFAKILISLGEYFYEKGVYFESRDYFEIALKLIQKYRHQESNYKIAYCIYRIGKCFCDLKNFETATIKCEESLHIYQELPDDERLDAHFEGDCYKEIALCKNRLGEKEQACESYEKALNLYTMTSSEKYKDVCHCFLNLGHCLYNLKKFEEAKVQFKALLDYISVHDEDTPAKRETFRGWCTFYIGSCLQICNCYEDALKCFQNAIEILQNGVIDQQKVEYINAKCCFSKGDCLVSLGEHSEAIKSFSKSAELWENLTSFGDQEYFMNLAKCYERIGLSHRSQNLHDEAIVHFLSSFKIFEENSKRASTDLNLSRLNSYIGEAHLKADEYEEACGYFNIALSIYRAARGRNKEIEAYLYKMCSLCLHKLGKFDDAKQHSEKALLINLELLQSKRATSTSLLKEIGFCYKYLNDNEQAIIYFIKYLDFLEEQNQSDSADMASILKNTGMCWQKEKKWNKAVQYFERSREKYKALPKQASVDIELAFLSNRIGKHYLLNCEPKKAKECFKSTLALCESQHSTSQVNSLHSFALKNLGYFYRDEKLFQKAIEYFEKAKMLYSTMEKNDQHKFNEATMLKCIGLCHNSIRGYCSEAFDCFKASLDDLGSLPGTRRHISEIAFVLKNMGYIKQNYWYQVDEAIDYFQLSLEEYLRLPSSDKSRSEIKKIQNKISQCRAQRHGRY